MWMVGFFVILTHNLPISNRWRGARNKHTIHHTSISERITGMQYVCLIDVCFKHFQLFQYAHCIGGSGCERVCEMFVSVCLFHEWLISISPCDSVDCLMAHNGGGKWVVAAHDHTSFYFFFSFRQPSRTHRWKWDEAIFRSIHKWFNCFSDSETLNAYLPVFRMLFSTISLRMNVIHSEPNYYRKVV